MFNLASEYLKTVDTSAWKKDKTVDANEINWLPIFTLTFDSSYNKRTVGITSKGYWTQQGSKGDIEVIGSRDDCYKLLILLTKQRSEFIDLLKTGLTKVNLNLKLTETFPIAELIKFALESGTPWARDAALWLNEDDIDEELDDLINIFIYEKRFPQQARHQAFKVLKRWQKHQ